MMDIDATEYARDLHASDLRDVKARNADYARDAIMQHTSKMSWSSRYTYAYGYLSNAVLCAPGPAEFEYLKATQAGLQQGLEWFNRQSSDSAIWDIARKVTTPIRHRDGRGLGL